MRWLHLCAAAAFLIDQISKYVVIFAMDLISLRAIDVLPSDDLNMMTVTTLVEAGRFDEARSFIEKARKRLPRQPLRRYNSKRYLDVLLTYVNEAGKLASKNTSPSTGE